MFAKCKNLIEVDLSQINTNDLENMEGMFSGCENLKK
jgi:hypothetical protein